MNDAQGSGAAARRSRGKVGLIAIALGVIALAAGGWWWMRAGRHDTARNQYAAVGTLRSVTTAQVMFQSHGVIDLDDDTKGEFGFLSELTGAGPTRSGLAADEAPYIAPVLGTTLQAGGIGRKSGYYFQLFLATAKGPAVSEPGAGTPPPANPADADAQEQRYCCYAWPVEYGVTGTFAYFVDHAGTVMLSDNSVQQYSGLTNTPKPEAAYRAADAGAPNLQGTHSLCRMRNAKTPDWSLEPGEDPAHDGGLWTGAGS
jgi:hypothetical protein